MKLGTSLLALGVAIPAAPMIVQPAQAQSLVERLFKNPAKRRRELREERIRRQQANRARIREIRRQRRASRVRSAQPQRDLYVQQPATPSRSTQRARVASTPKLESPKFFDYKPETLVTVDMTGAADVVIAALATERELLRQQPLLKPAPLEEAEDGRSTVRYAPSLQRTRSFAQAPSDLAGPAAAQFSFGHETWEPVELVFGHETYLPGEIDGLAVGAIPAEPVEVAQVAGDSIAQLINRSAAEGSTLGNGLDAAPEFEVVKDPRIDQLSSAEAAWRVMGSKSERATKPVADAVAAHYEASRRLMWTNGERIKPTARRAMATLSDAARFGLDPRDYTIRAVPGPGATTADHMQFELSLTVAVAEYLRDASIGRVVADRISGYHDLPRRDPLLAERLLEISESASPDAIMLEAHPRTREFGILQRELQRLLGKESVQLPELPPRVYLRAGVTSEYVPDLVTLLKARAAQSIKTKHAEALATYDDGLKLPVALDPFIRDVQAQFGLSPDGVIGPKSIARLAGQSNKSKIDRLVLAMERSRWLPSEFGDEYVMINSPAYWVQHLVGDKVNVSMRAVVGKPANQTNFFYDQIEHIEFNPDWGVPRSIIVNEMLPKLQADPTYLDRIGYEVRDARGRRVKSANVKWWKYGVDVPYSVVQPPGPRNALGELKIEFPNKHLIYMHDTNAKKLFNRTTRAFSHGCVRLADPRLMAAAMLGTDRADVRRRLARGHHNAPIDRDIPVYVGYFTAWPTDDGEVGYYADIYKRDAALSRALQKTRRARTI